MGRRWGALRAAARIARRDARRAKGRTALVAALIGLPVFGGTAGGVLISSTTLTDATYARIQLGEPSAAGEVVQARIEGYRGAGLQQSVRGESSSWSGTADVPPTVTEHAQAITALLPEGDRLLQVVYGAAGFSTAERAIPPTTDVVALPADGDLSAVFPIAEGVLPTAPDEVALSPATAERLDAAIGDAVTMDPSGDARTMTVSGLLAQVQQGPRVVAGPGAIAPPDSFPGMVEGPSFWVDWYVVGPEPVTWNDVLAINDAGSVVVSRAVLNDPPAPEDVPYDGRVQSSVDTGTLAMFGGVGAVIVLEAVLLIGPAFAVGARRIERQLALLAASGAERRTLRHVVLLTGVVTGLGAAVGGVVLGVLTAVGFRAVVRAFWEPFAFADLQVPWLLLAGFVAFGTLTATLAAWLPSRRAARVDVVAALAGRRPPVRHGRLLAVIGVVVAVAGLGAAVAGAVATQPIVLVAGVIALELGVVAAAGALVGLAALLAPRLGAIGRIALRDAARNRARTAPAVAAVLAGVAGITAGAVYLQSGEDYQARQYAPFAAVGTVAVSTPAAGLLAPDEQADLVEAATAAVKEHLPATAVHPVSLAMPATLEAGADTVITAMTPPENVCPLWAPEADTLSSAERRAAALEDRCRTQGGGGTLAWMTASGATTLVDDGSVVGALGYEGSARAAQALADGRVVVSSDLLLQADGTVRVVVEQYIPGKDEPVRGPAVDLPAEVVPLPGVQYGLVLPPDVVDRLGLRAVPAGLVVTASRAPTPSEEAATAAALGPDAQIYIERGNPFGLGVELILLVAAAVAVGLAATGISVALAAAESRPDLATLAAIGAEPRTRRRFTAAQAGVVSGLGTVLGVLAGLALGWVLVMAERYRWEVPDLDRVLSVPWVTVAGIAVGVPLLAMAVGYVATRSKLPVVRRLAA